MEADRPRHPHFDLSRILVIDLEATCWQGTPPPGEESEVIEIGNAVLHVGDLRVEPGPEILVQPIRSSVSLFCRELTSLTQEMLQERGLTFPRAIEALEEAHGKLRATVWASYGGYDRKMLLAECERFGLDFPLSDTEATPNGRHHRGGDDALEIARMLGRAMRGLRG